MPDNRQRLQKMHKLLIATFAPTQLNITDDSHLHIGHEGAKGGAGHFTIAIASPTLEGLSRIEQHRRIYACLNDMIGPDIHALKIKIL